MDLDAIGFSSFPPLNDEWNPLLGLSYLSVLIFVLTSISVFALTQSFFPNGGAPLCCSCLQYSSLYIWHICLHVGFKRPR